MRSKNHGSGPRSRARSARCDATPAAARQVLASAGGSAVRRDFAASLQRTLWLQVGAFLLSFLLMLALPAGTGRRRPEDPAAAAKPGKAILNATSASTVATTTGGGRS